MEENSTYYVDLISRYFAGEATPDEIAALSAWLKSDKANQSLFNEYQKTWSAVEHDVIESSINLNEEWNKFESKLNRDTDGTKELKIIP